MYRINKIDNNITKLEERLFSDLGFTERAHLQEWIAKNPDVLGEELLIIQKEFQGFNDTKERLDLLALDKEGSIVVIENKLDDTGRDVVWQALKYTSYCSTLTTDQIIKIYQDYLDAYDNGGDARENILDFIETGDEDDLLLNDGDQRIFFVANNYRKEVTSTVLWLLDHEVQIKCFKATPYTLGKEEFLQIEQIIPLPETAEFMIDAKEKQKEKKGKSEKVQKSRNDLVEFWSLLKQRNKENGSGLLDNVTPRPTYYCGAFKGYGFFAFCIGRNTFRVELYFRDDQEKVYFDSMLNYKNKIDEKLQGVKWERLVGKRSSRIKYEVEKAPGSWGEKQDWDGNITWFIESMDKFYGVIYPIWEKVQADLK